MKLSNKVLFAFFGAAFLYLTAVFAEVRLTGVPNVIDDSNSIAETADISGVSYLVLEDLDYNVSVIGSDRAQLEVRSMSGDLLNKLKHHVFNDTLTLSDFQSEGQRAVKISVFVPKAGLKGITVNSAEATVEGLQAELFYISQDGGRIRMSDNGIGNIHVEASAGSYLKISSTDVDTLSARIDNSEVSISSPVGIMQGSMKNKSFLHMIDVDEIQLKKDDTSRLHLYQ